MTLSPRNEPDRDGVRACYQGQSCEGAIFSSIFADGKTIYFNRSPMTRKYKFPFPYRLCKESPSRFPKWAPHEFGFIFSPVLTTI